MSLFVDRDGFHIIHDDDDPARAPLVIAPSVAPLDRDRQIREYTRTGEYEAAPLARLRLAALRLAGRRP